MSDTSMARLRDLGKWSGGNTPTKANSQYWSGGSIPWVSPKDMKVDEISSSEDQISELAVSEGRASILRSGAVLVVTRSGILAHTLPVAVTTAPVTINQDLKALTPNRDVSPKYVAYALRGASRRILKQCAKHGTTVASVETNALLDFEIPMLPLDQQRRVVAEIEKQFSRLDEAVANLQRVKANLRRHRAATLKAAADGAIFSDLNVQTWERTTIGEVAQVIGGLTKNPKRATLPTKLPYLRVANVYANELRLSEMEHIGVADSEVEKLLVRRGDLLVVEGNGSIDQIGRVALWDDSILNCVHQNHLIKVRFDERVLPEWGLAWLLSPGGRHEIEQVSASTSGLHTLSTGKVARLPIPVPSLAEQERVVAEVDRRLSIAREVEAEVEANLKRAQSLRQAVLAKAFSSAPA